MHSPEFLPREQEITSEKGANVKILLKMLRHGERDKQGNLTDYGRTVTKERAAASGLGRDNIDAVKAIGSTAGPKSKAGMPRSLETADIYSHEVAGDDAFETRKRSILSYENLVTPAPYDHVAVYNANLPENFNELADVEKAVAAKKAQAATVNHLIALDTPEAEAYKKEMAGAYATLIDHYEKMAKKLKSESNVLIPAGTHGGMMEFLLQQALVRKNEDGKEIVGFQDINDVGGKFDPSEAYNVEITTDEKGQPGRLKITFDNPSRPSEELYLDKAVLKEMQEFYASLHDPASQEGEV